MKPNKLSLTTNSFQYSITNLLNKKLYCISFNLKIGQIDYKVTLSNMNSLLHFFRMKATELILLILANTTLAIIIHEFYLLQ